MGKMGQLIIDERKKVNMSQSELADKLGVSKGYLSKLENGLKPISIKRLSQIGEVLDVEFFNCGNELFQKWQPVIDMFESNNVSPEEVLLLNEFISKLKN